ncbi:MAG: hypothetical protein P4L16_06900 [Chlamydiales bacterium]|nr:hypothetical protein [Chlamydiales bacterium]
MIQKLDRSQLEEVMQMLLSGNLSSMSKDVSEQSDLDEDFDDEDFDDEDFDDEDFDDEDFDDEDFDDEEFDDEDFEGFEEDEEE